MLALWEECDQSMCPLGIENQGTKQSYNVEWHGTWYVEWHTLKLGWNGHQPKRTEFSMSILPGEIHHLPTTVGCPQGHLSLGCTHPSKRGHIRFLMGPFTFVNNAGTWGEQRDQSAPQGCSHACFCTLTPRSLAQPIHLCWSAFADSLSHAFLVGYSENLKNNNWF